MDNADVLQWPERLEALKELQSFKLKADESKMSVYSAIHNHYPPKTQVKRFSVRWSEIENAYIVIRKKDRILPKNN